ILPVSAHPIDIDYLSITSQFPNLLALSLINWSTFSRHRSYTIDTDPSSIDADPSSVDADRISRRRSSCRQ
ncbi:hypothetical protein KI387_014745, partial [Taxus chinensis]